MNGQNLLVSLAFSTPFFLSDFKFVSGPPFLARLWDGYIRYTILWSFLCRRGSASGYYVLNVFLHGDRALHEAIFKFELSGLQFSNILFCVVNGNDAFLIFFRYCAVGGDLGYG